MYEQSLGYLKLTLHREDDLSHALHIDIFYNAWGSILYVVDERVYFQFACLLASVSS